jgi:hypothetical protein
LQDLLRVHDLPREELGDREADDVGRRAHIRHDAADLWAGQAVRHGAQPSTISLLSTVSTSKWIATREHLVSASHASSGRAD